MQLLLWFVLTGLAAHAASFTSSQSGGWSTPATWGGAGVPGNGDTVIIRHTVTLETDVTVGASPNTVDTSGTPAIDIQDTSTAGYDGHLVVPAGRTLTVRGNLKVTSTGTTHQARLTVQTGGAFVFDNTQPPSSGSALYRIYRNANGAESIVTFGSPGVTSPRTIFRGKPEGSSGTNSLFLNDGNGYSWVRTAIYGTDVYDCGSAADPCISTYEFSTTTGTVNIWDSDFYRTGGISLRTAGTSNAFSWILRRVRTIGTLNSQRSFHTSHPIALMTGGAREISDCYFDTGINLASFGQFEIRNTVFARNFYPIVHATAPSVLYWNKFENILIHQTSASASLSNLWGSAKDVFYVADSGVSNNNPHGLTPSPSLRRDVTLDGIIGQYNHPGGANGEGEFLNPTYCTTRDEYTFVIKNSIVLPNAFDQTTASYLFAGWNTATNPVPCRIELYHNTIMGAASEAGGGFMAGEGGNTVPANLLDVYKSNLYWDAVPGRLTAVHYFNGTGQLGSTYVDWMVPDGTSHNAAWNHKVVSGYSAPNNYCNGTPYEVPCSSPAGANDLYGLDPKFVDTSRNVQKWAQVNHGADGTMEGALAVFGATPASEIGARISGLLAYVRDGFRPRNPAYRRAGHDGATIGAVQMPAAPKSFSVINNPVVVD